MNKKNNDPECIDSKKNLISHNASELSFIAYMLVVSWVKCD